MTKLFKKDHYEKAMGVDKRAKEIEDVRAQARLDALREVINYGESMQIKSHGKLLDWVDNRAQEEFNKLKN